MFFLAPKELALIPDFMHLSQSALYYQYNKIKKHYGKGKGQRISVWEFAEYAGVPEGRVLEILKPTSLRFPHKVN